MSNDEQHLAIGRMVEEYGVIKKKLTALLSEADRHGHTLHSIARCLTSQYQDKGGVRFGDRPSSSALSMPSGQVVEALVEDIISTRLRKIQLQQQLKEIGLEQKD